MRRARQVLVHSWVHVEEPAHTEKTTLTIRHITVVGLNRQLIITCGYIKIDYVYVAKLLAEDFVWAERFLGRRKFEHCMIDYEVWANLEVESLCLIEAEVVRIHLEIH